MIIGTAGHVDHGKTSLVKALTSIDCDRLPDEKARGITIELGFAYWARPDGRTIGFVDVPGHKRLVHTMLAGACGIDVALLVIAANDGVMPQTQEHVTILDLLGVRHVIVALSKCDLVQGQRLEVVREEIEHSLAATAFKTAPVIPVSVHNGQGLDALVSTIDSYRAVEVSQNPQERFRMSADRVFTLDGIGTVVTGTVASGHIRVGDQIATVPSGLSGRIKSVRVSDGPADMAAKGQRAALALTGRGVNTRSIRRGDAVVDPLLYAPCERIDADVSISAGPGKQVKFGAKVRVHIGAAERLARILPVDGSGIPPGGRVLAQLVLDNSVSASVGERFILRDVSAQYTLGGGRVLDLHPVLRRRRSKARLAELTAIRDYTPEIALRKVIEARNRPVDLSQWARDRAFAKDWEEWATQTLRLIEVRDGKKSACFTQETWQGYTRDLLAKVDDHHRTQPDMIGLEVQYARRLPSPTLPQALFLQVIDVLAKEGVVQLDGMWLRRPWHKVRIDAAERRLLESLMQKIDGENRYRPPQVRALAAACQEPELRVRATFKRALKRGEVFEISRDRFFSADCVAEMRTIVDELYRSVGNDGFRVCDFRDRLSNGRRIALEVLEYFDRDGLTVRRGATRIVDTRQLATTLGKIEPNGGESPPVGRPDFKSGRGR